MMKYAIAITLALAACGPYTPPTHIPEAPTIRPKVETGFTGPMPPSKPPVVIIVKPAVDLGIIGHGKACDAKGRERAPKVWCE